jgi:5-methylcytosine-specific restriction endonuclease McrA
MKKRTENSKLQSKCDKLLTPIVKKLNPKCLLCGSPTEVAHHHIHKSKSSILRYDLDNLINLCHRCHQALHHNESYYASRIIQIKGLEWFEKLEKKKNQINRVNKGWYLENLKRLENELEKLSTD